MVKKKIDSYLNGLIFILVTIAVIMMFWNIGFTKGDALASEGFRMFQYFTVDSNVLMGVASLLYLFSKKKWVQVLKLSATACVTLTMIVTACYLAPIQGSNFLFLYTNSNFFFHLIIPILSIISFIFFETYNFTFKETLYSLIPVFLYAIFYIGNVVMHMDGGKISYQYDFYHFFIIGLKSIPIVLAIILGITYLFSFLFWKINKKLHKQ